MTISSTSVQKIFRDHFPDEEALCLSRAECEAWAAELEQRFATDGWVDTYPCTWEASRDKTRHRFLSIKVHDPDRSYYSNHFYLSLDGEDRLLIEAMLDSSIVSALREVWQSSLSFKTVSRRALPWGFQWIRHGGADGDSGNP